MDKSDFDMDIETRKLTLNPDKSRVKAIMTFPLDWGMKIREKLKKSNPDKDVFYNVFKMPVSLTKEFFILDFFPSVDGEEDADGKKYIKEFRSKMVDYFQNSRILIISEGKGSEIPTELIDVLGSVIRAKDRADTEGKAKVDEFIKQINSLDMLLNVKANIADIKARDVQDLIAKIDEVPAKLRSSVLMRAKTYKVYSGLKEKMIALAKELLDSFQIKLTGEQEEIIKNLVSKP